MPYREATRPNHKPWLPMLVPVGFFMFILITSEIRGLPYRLASDAAFQLKSVLQWLAGDTRLINEVSLPNPSDLAQSLSFWNVWWAPGVPSAFLPLVATGMPFALAVRLTCFVFFTLGVAAWYRVLRLLPLAPVTVWGVAIPLSGYALTIGGASRLDAGDVVAFGLGSWLIAPILRRLTASAAPKPLPNALLLSFSLGSLYWLKYSAFVAASGLFACLLISVFRERARPPLHRLAHALGSSLAFAIPVLSLTALNLRLGGALNTVVQAEYSFSLGDWHNAWPLLSLLGVPGSSLFNADQLTHHLAHFAKLPWSAVERIREWQPELIKAVAGLPGTGVIVWALIRLRRTMGSVLVLFVVVTVGVPLLVMAALTWRMGINLLAECDGYISLFMLLPAALVLEAGLQTYRNGSALARTGIVLLLTLFCVVPTVALATIFVRQDLVASRSVERSGLGIHVPTLSPRDAAPVAAAARSALRSPLDVVVIAIPEVAFVPWLLFPERSIPLGHFYGPLANGYGVAADVRASTRFVTSEPLRVVLVVNRDLIAAGGLPSLQARFPQAGPWVSVAAPPDARVALFASDLRPGVEASMAAPVAWFPDPALETDEN